MKAPQLATGGFGLKRLSLEIKGVLALRYGYLNKRLLVSGPVKCLVDARFARLGRWG